MLSIVAEQSPLADDARGVIRVGGTRVTLDTVVEAFNEGLSAEEIVQQYPSLRLSHVYGTITYHLNPKTEVDDYISQQQAEAAIIRQQNEQRFDLSDMRARLMDRREGQK